VIKVLQPPAAVEAVNPNVLTIFLAGSIEMGTAEDWQKKLIYDLHQLVAVAFNPRRDDWDPKWAQTIVNDNFRAQVIWELDALDRADLVIFYFDPKTTSPITLMELGMQAEQQQFQPDKTVIVCCPEGYFRKGNVDIVCKRYGIQLVDEYSKLVKAIKKHYTEL
jgi:hypothetical protein